MPVAKGAPLVMLFGVQICMLARPAVRFLLIVAQPVVIEAAARVMAFDLLFPLAIVPRPQVGVLFLMFAGQSVSFAYLPRLQSRNVTRGRHDASSPIVRARKLLGA